MRKIELDILMEKESANIFPEDTAIGFTLFSPIRPERLYMSNVWFNHFKPFIYNRFIDFHKHISTAGEQFLVLTLSFYRIL